MAHRKLLIKGKKKVTGVLIIENKISMFALDTWLFVRVSAVHSNSK